MLTKSKKGFTIIEVVIVLVIGAIIMLMVFLVVPFLQRSQRDSRRQNDARRFLSASEQYASNNNGDFPGSATNVASVMTDYVKDSNFKDPDGSAYGPAASNGGPNYSATFSDATSAAGNRMVFAQNSKCVSNKMAVETGSRNVVISVYQENGVTFCVEN